MAAFNLTVNRKKQEVNAVFGASGLRLKTQPFIKSGLFA